MAVWPRRGTPTGGRNGPTGISWISAKGSAKSCTRGRITPCTSTEENKHFYFRGDQTLERFVQASCGVSILGSTQNLAGCGPEQPALVGPAGSWEVGWDDSPEVPSRTSHLNHSVSIYQFCNENTDLLWQTKSGWLICIKKKKRRFLRA